MRTACPNLEPGRVYRTRDLRRWGANPARLAARLVEQGHLQKLRSGLFYRPETSRFGPVPPKPSELLRAFFAGSPYLVTGSPRWNELGLGATAVLAYPIIYNSTRTGRLQIGDRQFLLRRVRFPEKPTPEWFAVDLIENRDLAGVGLEDLEDRLRGALRAGRFDAARLQAMADEYGTRETQALVRRARSEAAS